MGRPRVVSLIAGATEIVCALGGEELLVGRSHECDHPASVTRLPRLTAPRIDVSGSSREIDARVKDAVRDALSVYQVDAEALASLRPDVIVTQSQCEVCAVSLADVSRALAERWSGPAPTIVSLAPATLEDVLEDHRRVARALGVPERGDAAVARLHERIGAVASRFRETRPTVACIEWIDPLMAAGNWVPELVALAGGENLFGRAGKHSPWMTFEELVARDPAVIAVMPCGWDVARARSEMGPLVSRPGWPRLRAVRDGRVFLCDGNRYFNRPGPRLVESLEVLAAIFAPGAPGRGDGWERYS